MKKIVNKLKEIYNMKNGKAIFFFGFYFLFFLLIFILSHIGGDVSSTVTPPTTTVHEYDFSSIEKNNYHYQYDITVDGVSYTYVGDRYNNKELFKLGGVEYYYDGVDYYVKNGVFENTSNPYLYSDLLNIKNISLLLDNAYLDSKTVYESGKKQFNYLLSSNTIQEKLYNINSDIMESPNTISIVNDQDDIKIILLLDSYCGISSSCNKQLKIELYYDDFLKIQEINSPIQ